MIRSRLLVVWALLLVLVGAIVAMELPDLVASKSSPDSGGQVDPEARMLLPVPVNQLGAVELFHAGTLHRFERDAAGAWFYHGVHRGSEGTHGHQADPSTAQRIEKAFAAFGRTRVERQFTLKMDGNEYGVTAPRLIILVYRPNDPKPLAQYAVGDIAPDGLSRYVRQLTSATVATIANYQIDNLLALIQAVGGESEQSRVTATSPCDRTP